MSGIPDFKNLVFKDTSFANLMNKRIYNVLLIATKYDAFMLEDDGAGGRADIQRNIRHSAFVTHLVLHR